MELVLGTNFDDRLVDEVRDLPVTTFFGGFPVSLTGAGRPPYILPAIDEERFAAHLDRIHRRERLFYATLNSNDLGLREYAPEYLAAVQADVLRLLGLGVDGFVVALPVLMEAIRAVDPHVPVSVSTFARLRTVNQALYYRRLGAEHVILEEGNRDFRLIRGLARAQVPVEVLVNQTCLRDCPYRAHHLNTSSLASQTGAPPLWFEYPILQCGLEVVRDPTKVVSSIWIRPEDLGAYEEAGVHRFKISGRNRSTEWLAKVARAYTARRYDGNLLDLLSFVQVKAPSQALSAIARSGTASADLAAPLARAFRPLHDLTIDNTRFPADFMRRIAATDCEHTSCASCGYCARVAEEVVRIGGEPPSGYRPPPDLPSPHALLPMFAGAAPPAPRAPD